MAQEAQIILCLASLKSYAFHFFFTHTFSRSTLLNFFFIFQVLYAKPEEETPEGEVADAREKATRELPVMEYPQTNTCVFPPLGWQEDREKLFKRSGTVPSQVKERGLNTGRRREEAGVDEGESR